MDLYQSPTPPILLEQLDRHRMIKLPDHLNGPIRFEAHKIRRPKESERRSCAIYDFPRTNEEQHCDAAFLVMDQVLS